MGKMNRIMKRAWSHLRWYQGIHLERRTPLGALYFNLSFKPDEWGLGIEAGYNTIVCYMFSLSVTLLCFQLFCGLNIYRRTK